MQPSYLYIWRQTILEFDSPSSVLKLLLVSSFSPPCKLFFIVLKKFLLWKVIWFLANSKWSFSPISLAASRTSIILELISKLLIIFHAGLWKGLVRVVINNCWLYCSCISFCPCENSLWLQDVSTFILSCFLVHIVLPRHVYVE